MKRALLVLLSAALLGLGCGDDDDSGSGKDGGSSGSSGSGGKSDAGTPSSTQVAKKMIAAKSGGTIESSGAALDIPAGALSEDTEITLGTIAKSDLPDAKNVASKGYDFGPDGTKFKKPVALTIDFDGNAPDGKKAVMAWLDNGKWTQLDDSAVDGKSVTASTTHFTTFAIVFVSNGGDAGGITQQAGSCVDDYDTSCGGKVAGSWDFSAACVTLGPNAFKDDNGKDPFGGCKGVKLSANADFSGTVTFKDDGTYENKLMSQIDVEISIPMSCLMGATCDVFDGGVADGDACVSKQMGVKDMKDETGTYTTDGNSIEMIKDGETSSTDQSEYCVDGDTLTVKVLTDDGTTVVFQAKRQ
jgi:hypothetical protein